ncbi:MAG: Veg family protein [Vallitaleaceae bacterium]|nr:Veg family protein [Vallitaleaceae bacterium]
MKDRNDITDIRSKVEEYIGNRVRIKANKGRKRVVIKEGYVENTYPSIFLVNVHNEQLNNYRKVSYSYTDILTHNVELTICD